MTLNEKVNGFRCDGTNNCEAYYKSKKHSVCYSKVVANSDLKIYQTTCDVYGSGNNLTTLTKMLKAYTKGE